MFNHSKLGRCLCTALFAVSLLSSGCSPDSKKSSSDKLVIYDWSGYEAPEFHAKFTEKYSDQAPQFAFVDTDEEGYSKAKSGFKFDIVHPCTQFFKLYAKNGLIQPIDTSRIKRWKDLVPSFVEAGKVDGVQYVLPYDWGYESILVRTDKVQKVPQSWADLWNPQYAGHLVLFDAADANHIIAALALGMDPWNTTPEENEQIKQKLIELKPNVLTYWSEFTKVKELVASGEAWVTSNVWNDSYAGLLSEGFSVKYVTPKEGRIGWLCGYAISSKTEKLDMVYDYLNARLDPKSQAAFGDAFAYGVSSHEALGLMDQRLVKRMQLNDPDVQERTVFYKDWTEEQRQSNIDRWNQVKAAP